MSDSTFARAPAPLSRFFRIAVLTGVESAVRIHIDRGDDLNARDDKGQTPLMLSAARNKAAICKLLLDAGADATLLDTHGRSALSVAQIAGATEAASVIEALCRSQTNHLEVLKEPAQKYLDEQQAMAVAELQADGVEDVCAPPPTEQPAAVLDEAATTVPDVGLDLGIEATEFDLTGWLAEEESSPPENDATLSAIASEIQSVISEHAPIDTSADWDGFDDFLPEWATPLPRSDDAEARERLRLVLLRAMREGSIPAVQIDDLSRGADGEPDPEAVALLSMVINDLGAETDERFEYRAPHESFEIFVAPEENADEEDAIDEAVAFVDGLLARTNEPLRIYQRELQRGALLTAEAEVALGQAMERGIEKALDALAAWPSGIGAVLHAAKSVVSGAKPLRWLSSGPPIDPEDHEATPNGESNIESEPETSSTSSEDGGDAQFGIDSKESSDELEEMRVNAEILSGLSVAVSQDGSDWRACREAIVSLGLTRSFLMELADSKLPKDAESAQAFYQAIKDYRNARDQMAVANLKLVYSIAKRYLFSGQPLDDLLQEGNIGLIRAVDRYDWRRGFKFSTYATWWIRQQVGRYVADKGKTIRLPVHVYESMQRIAQVVRAFEFQRGHAPTFEEISESVGLPIKKVLALHRLSMEPLPLHEVNSLDEHIAADAKDDYTARDPLDIVEDMQLIKAIDQLLGTIKLKEARILRMRFGIGIQDSLTLEEVGARLEVTRERIRQIEAKALRRLKSPGRLDQLMRELHGAPPHKSADLVDAPSDADDESDGEEQAIAAQKPRPARQATPTSTVSKGSVSITVEKLLNHARAIGITVEDYPEGVDRRIWVHITDTPDKHSRRVVRNLIELGFSFWPGKGYWR